MCSESPDISGKNWGKKLANEPNKVAANQV
jgi:hypothetical protein